MQQDFSFDSALVVSLPHGNKALSANASVPKTPKGVFAAARKKQRAKRTGRTLAWAVTLKVLDGRKAAPNRYMIRWFYKFGNPPDDDNAVARCKAYLDGASLAMGINDRTLRLVGVERVKDLRRFKEVELVFWHEEGAFSVGLASPEAGEKVEENLMNSERKNDREREG